MDSAFVRSMQEELASGASRSSAHHQEEQRRQMQRTHGARRACPRWLRCACFAPPEVQEAPLPGEERVWPHWGVQRVQ